MFEFLQNVWAVGISAGIVSGLVVFFITKWLFSNQSSLAHKVPASTKKDQTRNHQPAALATSQTRSASAKSSLIYAENCPIIGEQIDLEFWSGVDNVLTSVIY